MFSRYDPGKNTITVEQGRPFTLKYMITASPPLTNVDLYKDGKRVHTDRTISVGLDQFNIQTVDRQSYAGKYKISARNSEGEGNFTFELNVKGTQDNNKD